jgi:hypothetical protein
VSAPLCPVCKSAMLAADVEYLAEYTGAPTHSCEHHLCRGRAWVNPDGSVTYAHNINEIVSEIHRRTPHKEEAPPASHR